LDRCQIERLPIASASMLSYLIGAAEGGEELPE
jgi:hypothetical protein